MRSILKEEQYFTTLQGKVFKDNDERMIFFTKGVIETVKKLNWSPDIIHLHGWFTSLFPLYLKSYYADEPLFSESKIVYSVYEPDFKGVVSKKIYDKVAFDKIDAEHIGQLKKADYNGLTNLASTYSDGVIAASENLTKDVLSDLKNSKKPFLEYPKSQEDKLLVNFYSQEI